MIKYDIKALIRRSRKTIFVIMPRIDERLSTVISYTAALRRMLKVLAQEVNRTIIPAYRSTVTRDADAGSFQRLKQLAEALVRIAQAAIDRIITLEAYRHTDKFMDDARRILGIDVRAVVSNEDLSAYLQMAARRNADLIKSLADDLVRKVEAATIQQQLAGSSVKELRKRFTEEFGIADKRAKIIARDQTAKLNSDLNQIRQQQAGIEEYEWSTSNDERVRERHKTLEGKRYRWGQATGAESGLPPGQPILCRCVARAVVQF